MASSIESLVRQSRPPVSFEYKDSTSLMTYNRAMEKFIISGGTYPREDSVRRRINELDDNEREESFPDDAMPPDDPKWDYASDEYDDWF